MRILLALLLVGFTAGAQSKQKKLNDLKLQLAHTRLQIINADGGLTVAHNRLMRKHASLAKALSKHPQIKASKLKGAALSALKIQVLKEDEDLREMRQIILKMHRKLEEALNKKEAVKALNKKISASKK